MSDALTMTRAKAQRRRPTRPLSRQFSARRASQCAEFVFDLIEAMGRTGLTGHALARVADRMRARGWTKL